MRILLFCFLFIISIPLQQDVLVQAESFPYELTGAEKVKESLGRIIKAYEILKMNMGTIYLDFGEPIHISEYTFIVAVSGNLPEIIASASILMSLIPPHIYPTKST